MGDLDILYSNRKSYLEKTDFGKQFKLSKEILQERERASVAEHQSDNLKNGCYMQESNW